MSTFATVYVLVGIAAEPQVGLEPTTYCLQGSCATICATKA